MDIGYLISTHDRIRSLDDALDWRQRAAHAISVEQRVEEDLVDEISRAEDRCAELRREAVAKSFVWRFFKTRDEKDMIERVRRLKAKSASTGMFVDQLQALVDQTPANAADLAAMLKEAKLDRKELQIEKRELAADMRRIRDDARRRSAHADGGLMALVGDRKAVAAKRRSIRYSKEQALQGPEAARRSLEDQLLEVERRISWLERLAD